MKIALTLILAFSVYTAKSQYVEEFRIQGPFDAVQFDNLLNVYALKESELFKYNSSGVFQFRFSNKQLGDIGTVDVTYPLRPFVHYPELNYVVLLDNTLSDNRGRVNLTAQGIGLGTLAAASVQNHFWIYDAMSFELIRLNENFRPVSRTGNLSQVLKMDLNPNFLVEYANRIYLNDPAKGIFVFDIFGTFIKTIPLIGLREFQVFENEIVFFKSGNLHIYNTLLFQEQSVELPLACDAAYKFKNRIAALCAGDVIVWQVIKP